MGQDTPELIFSMEANTLASAGRAYELSQLAPLQWAPEATREQLQTAGPLLAGKVGQDSVAVVFRALGNLSAQWATAANGMILATGQAAMGPALARDAGSAPFSSSLGAVAGGSSITATDGLALFSLQGASALSFDSLTASSQTQALPVPFTAISNLIGKTTGVAGSGLATGMPRLFAAEFPRTFTPWDSAAAGDVGAPVASPTALYFVKDGGGSSFACRATSVLGSTTCAPSSAGERASGLALGAGDTLYVVVTRPAANTTFLQVRTASTLALRDEIPLPGVTGACLSLTPTCIAGRPVVGCVDSVGRIVFVFTDARGIDTTADWPMEGHDPAKTFNTATYLSRYSCP